MGEPMFSGDLSFLSNFDSTQFEMSLLGGTASDGMVASGEHAFNGLKTLDPQSRAWILEAPTPGEAKRRGRARTIGLREGWDSGLRVRAMQSVLLAKFRRPDFKERLLGTGHTHLVETNHWHDQFWGDCYCPTHRSTPGVNMLGELLMALRARE